MMFRLMKQNMSKDSRRLLIKIKIKIKKNLLQTLLMIKVIVIVKVAFQINIHNPNKLKVIQKLFLKKEINKWLNNLNYYHYKKVILKI